MCIRDRMDTVDKHTLTPSRPAWRTTFVIFYFTAREPRCRHDERCSSWLPTRPGPAWRTLFVINSIIHSITHKNARANLIADSSSAIFFPCDTAHRYKQRKPEIFTKEGKRQRETRFRPRPINKPSFAVRSSTSEHGGFNQQYVHIVIANLFVNIFIFIYVWLLWTLSSP